MTVNLQARDGNRRRNAMAKLGDIKKCREECGGDAVLHFIPESRADFGGDVGSALTHVPAHHAWVCTNPDCGETEQFADDIEA